MHDHEYILAIYISPTEMIVFNMHAESKKHPFNATIILVYDSFYEW